MCSGGAAFVQIAVFAPVTHIITLPAVRHTGV